MRRMAVIIAAVLAVAGCGGKGGDGNASTVAGADTSAPPVKHQPGSWSTKLELTKLDAGPGVDTAKMKGGLQQMFDAASGVTTCLTPEMAAKDNPAANMERMAAQGKKCDFDRKIASGERLDFAGTCSDGNGTKMRVAIAGVNTATSADVTVKTEPADATGPMKGSMEMRITSRRTGECKPGDVTPPMPS